MAVNAGDSSLITLSLASAYLDGGQRGRLITNNLVARLCLDGGQRGHLITYNLVTRLCLYGGQRGRLITHNLVTRLCLDGGQRGRSRGPLITDQLSSRSSLLGVGP